MASRAKDWLSRRWPSLACAVLLLLAFPPFDVWPLALVALAPLFWQLLTVDGREAWRIGYLFGLVYFLGQLFWLYSLAVHWTHSPAMSLLPWVLGSLYVALYFGLACALIRYCMSRGWFWLAPIVWAGIEVCRSFVPIFAFPWGLAATPLYPIPGLIQLAHFGTIYLVSAWVVLVNLVIALWAEPGTRKAARPLLAATGALMALSVTQLGAKVDTTPLRVTVGQPAVDLAFGDLRAQPGLIADSVDRITHEAILNGSKLLILPEGIGDDQNFPPQTPFLVTKEMPVVFGGQRRVGKDTFQTAYAFDGKWGYADKIRLVIFGEFVPGRSTFPALAKWFDLPTVDLSAGRDGVRAVDVGGTRVGPMLCFEGLFSDVAYRQALNNAKFIAVMSIDDWYMGTPAPEQLMAGSVFRAVETGLPVVRSASLGHTIVVDSHGRIVSSLPLKKPGQIDTTLQVPASSPVFPLLPVFPIASVGVVLLLTAMVIPRRKQSSSKVSSNKGNLV